MMILKMVVVCGHFLMDKSLKERFENIAQQIDLYPSEGWTSHAPVYESKGGHKSKWLCLPFMNYAANAYLYKICIPDFVQSIRLFRLNCKTDYEELHGQLIATYTREEKTTPLNILLKQSRTIPDQWLSEYTSFEWQPIYPFFPKNCQWYMLVDAQEDMKKYRLRLCYKQYNFPDIFSANFVYRVGENYYDKSYYDDDSSDQWFAKEPLVVSEMVKRYNVI